MRVLTIRQPWASAIIDGLKPVENRRWSTSYRGDVAILAAGKITDHTARAFALCEALTAPNWRCVRGFDHLPRGRVIGVVELHDVVTSLDNEWFTGPYGLLVRNPRRLQRGIAWRGQLRMFAAPAELETQIKEQLP